MPAYRRLQAFSSPSDPAEKPSGGIWSASVGASRLAGSAAGPGKPGTSISTGSSNSPPSISTIGRLDSTSASWSGRFVVAAMPPTLTNGRHISAVTPRLPTALASAKSYCSRYSGNLARVSARSHRISTFGRFSSCANVFKKSRLLADALNQRDRHLRPGDRYGNARKAGAGTHVHETRCALAQPYRVARHQRVEKELVSDLFEVGIAHQSHT